MQLINNGVEYCYDKIIKKLKSHRGDYPYMHRLLKRIGILK